MHRLVIVSGPNRGSAFSLIEGDNLIGRQMDNHIVLSSSKVSKKHCSIVVNSGEVQLRDDGSTNGTFVNGALTRQQTLRSGDKLGVGEFVLELVKAQTPASIASGASSGGLSIGTSPGMMMPTPDPFQSAPARPVSLATASFKDLDPVVEESADPASKLKVIFEGKIMPFFYGMIMKNDFRSVVGLMFLVTGAIGIAGAVMPMQDLAEQGVRREAFIRARVLSREVADRFAGNIAGHTESQIDFSFLENEESIKSVVITNANLQIIAPASRLNQLYAGGLEANFAMAMAKAFREGRETGSGRVFQDENISVWVEPIKLNDPRQVRSQVAALALVSVDFSSNMIAAGGLGVAYGTSIAIGGLAFLACFIILMRLFVKPYEVLNEELDQVLRGEMSNVTQEFKMDETRALWDNINAAVQRIPKDGGSAGIDDGPVNWDQVFEPTKGISELGKFAFVAFDPSLNCVSLNDLFSEISGIRSDAIGQALSQIADQSLTALVIDLMKVASGSPMKMATDRFPFQGDDYEVIANAIQVKGQSGLAILFKRKG
jgi:hypothetical protein